MSDTASNFDRCDVLVIGGGPAGSTVSALLAGRGRDVVLVEKEKHPRFHIGESLLPFNMPLFEDLGVAEEIRRIGMLKYGAEFVSPWHSRPISFEFANAMGGEFPFAYQVRRSEFDEILFRHAARRGARAVEECRVTSVEFDPEGATVSARDKAGAERRWRARFVVDASGRDTFLAGRLGTKRRSREHNTSAIFGHFSGAQRLPGKAEGNITILWFEHGWFWFIPLSDGTTSVGAVCYPYYMRSRKVPPQQFFMDTIALCPALADRLRDAKLVAPVTATGNYSYEADRTTGQNYLMLGDAFTFIDPVFSTGVYLAMHSAFAGADAIETCLDRPREAAASLRAFDASMRRGPRVFSWFIYRVTAPALRNLFMDPHNTFRLRDALLSVLAGDIYRGTPVGLRLLALKGLYYLGSIFTPVESLKAWKKRRQAVRETGSEAAAAH